MLRFEQAAWEGLGAETLFGGRRGRARLGVSLELTVLNDSQDKRVSGDQKDAKGSSRRL